MTKPRPVCNVILASIDPVQSNGPARVCYRGSISDPNASDAFSFQGPPGLFGDEEKMGEFLARLLHGTDDSGANTLNFYWTAGFDVWDVDGSVQHVTPKISVTQVCKLIVPINQEDHLEGVLDSVPVGSAHRPRM